MTARAAISISTRYKMRLLVRPTLDLAPDISLFLAVSLLRIKKSEKLFVCPNRLSDDVFQISTLGMVERATNTPAKQTHLRVVQNARKESEKCHWRLWLLRRAQNFFIE
jgi:hypothetical protein